MIETTVAPNMCVICHFFQAIDEVSTRYKTPTRTQHSSHSKTFHMKYNTLARGSTEKKGNQLPRSSGVEHNNYSTIVYRR